ncbi:cyclin-P3-1 [Ricinus communis]|uniref:Cyclin-dependent protein kinase, putative n=1 Tax=Ricinus communis TaxID=3988 RepID=B9RF55_RICCO|nr:cyclin-P3-1 [Ricinus communis]EEF49826.1 cyclin-dependent protein kinase, putative [Ricinus communis]|eukprot:XP_002512374.1 cyclin-P3-1 [Ricinus communis]
MEVMVGSETYSALGLYESGGRISGTPRVLLLLASVLERSTQKNDRLLEGSRRKDVVTVFHGSRSPSLSIRQYIERVFKYTKCSTSCFVVAYIYVERFLRRMDACLTSLNVHRLLITSIMLAAKFLDDECYNNAYYAKVGGVSTPEMNRMETKLLFNLDFRLQVTVEAFRSYCLKLERECGGEYRIERPIHVHGPKGVGRQNRSDIQNASTFASFSQSQRAT